MHIFTRQSICLSLYLSIISLMYQSTLRAPDGIHRHDGEHTSDSFHCRNTCHFLMNKCKDDFNEVCENYYIKRDKLAILAGNDLFRHCEVANLIGKLHHPHIHHHHHRSNFHHPMKRVRELNN